ncbi:hypothetical protein MMC13_004746 [Lambiella insularis]|nr:hypothetical protein [Lambiella insularis]
MAEIYAPRNPTLNLLPQLPTIFIPEVNGHATPGDNEFILHTDLRFAGPNNKTGAVEVLGGIQLTRLVDPGYATHHLVACDTVDAAEVARIGWVNAACRSAEEARTNAHALAMRLATWPADALAVTEQSTAGIVPGATALQDDTLRLGKLLATSQALLAIAKSLELSENRTDGPFEERLVDDAVLAYE